MLIKKGTVVSKTGHTSSDWIVDKESPANTEGSKHKECTICKTVLEIADIKPVVKKPATVKNVKAAPAGKNKVKITWNQVSDADGYLIYAKKNGTYAYCGVVTSKTKTYYTDKKASKKEYNVYRVYPYHKTANGKRVIGETCDKYVYGKAK